jgi:RimJ/RimL family protein N-acetyltransferase
MYRYIPNGSELSLRPITDSDEDCYLVAKWRNTEEALASFMTRTVTTPDTHREFIHKRKLHDLVWIVEGLNSKRTRIWDLNYDPSDAWVPVGMVSLTVETMSRTGEIGRLFVDPGFKRGWLAKKVMDLANSYAFEVLNLKYVWCDVRPDNKAVIWLHKKAGWHEISSDSLGLPYSLRRDDMIFLRLNRSTWQERKSDTSIQT